MHVSNQCADGFATVEATPEATKQQTEIETNQLFLPFRGFCSRKGVCNCTHKIIYTLSPSTNLLLFIPQIEVKEVVLEDSDVSKAISEYIATQHIHNIVVGASSRKSLTKLV